MMGRVNDSTVGIWLSRLKQADYNTKIATTSNLWKKFIPTDRALAEYAPNVSDNRGFATTTLEPTEQYVNYHSVRRSLSFQLSSYWLAYFLHKLRGTVSTSQPDATNAAAVRRHLFARQDLASDPDARVFGYIEKAGGHDIHYPSMACTRLNIGVDNEQRITASVDVIGSGKRIDPSGTSGLATESDALDVFFGSACGLTIGDGDTDIQAGIAGRLVSYSIGLSANIAEDDMRPIGAGRYQGDDPASGAVASQALITDMPSELQFALRIDSAGDPFYTWLQQQTDLAAAFSFDGSTIAVVDDDPDVIYRHSALFQFDRVRIRSVQIQSRNNLLVAAMTATPLWDFTNNRDALIRVDNTTTSYTS